MEIKTPVYESGGGCFSQEVRDRLDDEGTPITGGNFRTIEAG